MQLQFSIGTTGIAAHSDFSFSNHFAFGGGFEYSNFNRGPDRTNEYSIFDFPFHPYGNVNRTVGNFDFGYFNKFNSNSGFDLFAQYDFERLTGQFTACESCTTNHYDYKYPSISIQPSFYHDFKNNFSLAAATRLTFPLDNFFTYDTTYTEIDRIRNYKTGSLFLTPAIEAGFGKNFCFKFLISYSIRLSKEMEADSFFPLNLSLNYSGILHFGKRNKTSEPLD